MKSNTTKRKIYIFGAHSRGRTLAKYLEVIEPETKLLGYLYSNEEANPLNIDGVEVFDLSDERVLTDFQYDSEVYIATRGIYHAEILTKLNAIGISNIIPVTPQLDNVLRNRFFEIHFSLEGKKFEKINDFIPEGKDEPVSSSIFVAKTANDNILLDAPTLEKCEKIVQAGAVLSDQKLEEATHFDDIGDNISDKNKQFCELTALYWIWKNSKDDIVGLEHWRRRFLLPDNWTNIFASNDIDVILPTPLCVMPSLEDNFKERHVPEVWDTTMELLKEEHPEDYEDAVSFFKECSIYSPCNMLIAKREVLDEYCEWLFPILLKLSEKIGTLEDKYQNRYPGFVAERLENYFFHKNEDRFRIVYADKSFLS